MKRRFLILALAATLALSLLAGCGSSGNAETPAPTETTPTVESTPVETPLPETESPVETTPAETPVPDESPAATPPAVEESTTPSAKPTEQPIQTPSQAPSTDPAPSVPPAAPQTSVVQSVWGEISALEIPALMELDAETLASIYGLDTADLVEYTCQMPMMNVQATEFFIAQVKDGSMNTVKAAVEARQAALEEQWAQYLPEQLEIVRNYKLVINGNYILFAVSFEADKAVDIFNSYTK